MNVKFINNERYVRLEDYDKLRRALFDLKHKYEVALEALRLDAKERVEKESQQ